MNRPDARSHASTARSRFAAGGEWLRRETTRRGFVRRRRWRRETPPPPSRASAPRASPRDPRANLRRPGESNPFRFEGFHRRRRRRGSTVAAAGFDRRRAAPARFASFFRAPRRDHPGGTKPAAKISSSDGRSDRVIVRCVAEADGSSAKASSSSAAVLGGGGDRGAKSAAAFCSAASRHNLASVAASGVPPIFPFFRLRDERVTR